jgi:dipeptidyl aminopeptidase/acylaminoacyl peptidase
VTRVTRVAATASAILVLAGCGSTASPAPTQSLSAPIASLLSTASPSIAPQASPTASPSPVSTPAITGLTGRILFARAGGEFGEGTVFLVSIDGTNEQQLGPQRDSGGIFATRDGSRIVYFELTPEGRGSAVVANGDGSSPGLLPLPAGTINLATGPFSPDGSRLLREGFDDAHPEVSGIYVTDIHGGGLKRLTTRHFIPGDWSPDGRSILVFDNEAPTSEPPAPGQLYVLKADGTGVRQLTPSDVQVQCCGTYRWSSDGRTIVFASQDGVLYTIAADGSAPTEIFTDDQGRYAISPTWSPDGSMILFALDPTPNPFAHPQNEIYVIRADGTGLTQVIATSDFKREISWLPPK